MIVGFTVNSSSFNAYVLLDNLRSKLHFDVVYAQQNTIIVVHIESTDYELLNLIIFDSESLILAQSERWRRG